MPKAEKSPSTCPDCGATFSRPSEMRRHRLLHQVDIDSFKLPCPYCPHRTLQKQNLITHINARHLFIKPHKCRVIECGRSFADPAALNRHEKNIHGVVKGGKVKRKHVPKSEQNDDLLDLPMPFSHGVQPQLAIPPPQETHPAASQGDFDVPLFLFDFTGLFAMPEDPQSTPSGSQLSLSPSPAAENSYLPLDTSLGSRQPQPILDSSIYDYLEASSQMSQITLPTTRSSDSTHLFGLVQTYDPAKVGSVSEQTMDNRWVSPPYLPLPAPNHFAPISAPSSGQFPFSEDDFSRFGTQFNPSSSTTAPLSFDL